MFTCLDTFRLVNAAFSRLAQREKFWWHGVKQNRRETLNFISITDTDILKPAVVTANL